MFILIIFENGVSCMYMKFGMQGILWVLIQFELFNLYIKKGHNIDSYMTCIIKCFLLDLVLYCNVQVTPTKEYTSHKKYTLSA